jgi:hypothetical protein
LTADECRPEFAYLRQALSEELTRILQSEFGGWSPEEREDLLTLACNLCRQLGEVFCEQALTSFNPDSPHDEVGTLEWDDERGVWKDRPRHDDASHGADAFLTFACSGFRPPNAELYRRLASRDLRWIV